MDETLEKVKIFLKERNWDSLRPSDVAKSISIEAAELLENFQWESLTVEETKQNPERLERVKKEVADVLIYTLEMCSLLGLDPKKLVEEKLDHNSKKYPAELMKARGADVKHTSEDPYFKIKEEWRKGR